MRVAITGARGFVGGALCRLLVAQGWQVEAYDVRTDAEPEHTAGVAIQRFDITDGPLRDAPQVDAVVHLAAFVSDTGRLELARRVNVGGTANTLASFPGARFVHVSSCSVYDPHHAQHLAREDEAPEPHAVRWSNAYGRTKSEAEQLLRQRAPDAVVLRPHAVYGPGDTTLLPRLRAAARRGTVPLPNGGRQLHSLTHVDNLAQACRLSCLPDAPAGAYNINDGDPISLADAFARICAVPGQTLRIAPIPLPVMLGLAACVQTSLAFSDRVSGRTSRPILSRYSVEHLALERTFDTTAARTRLNYQPAPTQLDGAHAW